MGWASGFRAGSELAQGALDTYYDVKRKREMRDVEQGLQQQQADRQAALDAYTANTGIAAQQPQATQVGLGQQFNPQQSLVTPQQPQLRGTNQVAPGQMSPVSGEQLGLGAAPQAPMSAAAVERMRADRLRGLGYTDEADKAYTRATQLDELETEERRFGIEQARLGRSESREERRLKMAEESAELDAKLTNLNINAAKLEYDDKVALNNAYDAYDAHMRSGKSENSFYDNDAWKNLGLKNQRILVESATDVASGQQELGSIRLSNLLDRAQTLDDMAEIVSSDRSITPDAAVRIDRDEDTGKISVVYYNDIAGSKDYGKEITSREFSTEEAAMANFRISAGNPALGAKSYADAVISAETLAFERGMQVLSSQADLAELEASVMEELLGFGGAASLQSMAPTQQAELYKEVDRIMEPYREQARKLGLETSTQGGYDATVFKD